MRESCMQIGTTVFDVRPVATLEVFLLNGLMYGLIQALLFLQHVVQFFLLLTPVEFYSIHDIDLLFLPLFILPVFQVL